MPVIEGLKELDRKLAKLDSKLAAKHLRTAARKAMAPVQREMKAAAPVGKKAHKTHKGTRVFPGFLKRAVKLRSSSRRGKIKIRIGVLKEAFYGVLFLDEGISVTSRKGKALKKPYTITGRNWFEKVFLRNRTQIEKRFKDELKKQLNDL